MSPCERDADGRPERYLQRHTVREADQAGKELADLVVRSTDVGPKFRYRLKLEYGRL